MSKLNNSVILVDAFDIRLNSRSKTEIAYLLQAGYNVQIICRNFQNNSVPKQIEVGEHKVTVSWYNGKRQDGANSSIKALLRFWWFTFKILFKNRKGLFAVQACNFGAAPGAFIFTRIFFRKKFVYSIHDLYTHLHPVTSVKLAHYINIGEAIVAKKATLTILAHDGQLQWLKGIKFKHEPIIIYPSPVGKSIENKNIKLNPNNLSFCQLGSQTGIRFTTELLDIFSNNPNWHIIFAGNAGAISNIKSYAARFPNIKYIGSIPHEKALEIQQNTDIMISMIHPTPGAVRYPHKYFEAMQLGKPIIVSAGSAASKDAEKLNYGFVSEYNKEHFVQTVKKQVLTADIKALDEHARRLFDTQYSGNIMAKRLSDAYGNLSNKI
ncbi:MAG: hypothetical protein QM613_03360 [Micrococcaceae bacterium]